MALPLPAGKEEDSSEEAAPAAAAVEQKAVHTESLVHIPKCEDQEAPCGKTACPTNLLLWAVGPEALNVTQLDPSALCDPSRWASLRICSQPSPAQAQARPSQQKAGLPGAQPKGDRLGGRPILDLSWGGTEVGAWALARRPLC